MKLTGHLRRRSFASSLAGRCVDSAIELCTYFSSPSMPHPRVLLYLETGTWGWIICRLGGRLFVGSMVFWEHLGAHRLRGGMRTKEGIKISVCVLAVLRVLVVAYSSGFFPGSARLDFFSRTIHKALRRCGRPHKNPEEGKKICKRARTYIFPLPLLFGLA